MYSLEDIWNQAMADTLAVKQSMQKGIVIVGSGVKIQKFGDNIEILNMNKGGDYYKVLDENEYNIFHSDGWRKGAINLAISNCLFKLGLIEEKIKTEVNTRKNDKHIQNLKNRREGILNKYTKHKQKLNQIK